MRFSLVRPHQPLPHSSFATTYSQTKLPYNHSSKLPAPHGRLPGQVVLATPVTVVAGKLGDHPLTKLYSYLCTAVTCLFAFFAPIFQNVFTILYRVLQPLAAPICFCIILLGTIAGLLDLTHAIIDWIVRQPANLFGMLTGVIADPDLNGAARGATCISTLACFTFAHFCSRSAFAYREPLLNVTIPARPAWELLLGTRSDIELGKQFTDSASSVTTVLEDLALMCHSDHLADVAAMRSFALNAKIGSDSVEQGDVRDGLFTASRYGSDMLSGVEGVAQLSTTILSSVRTDVKTLIRKVAAQGPSRSFYYAVRAVLTKERSQITRLIREVERVEGIAIKATQHYDRFQPLLSTVYKKYDEAYSSAPPWSIALDYAVSTLGHIFVGKAPSDLGYLRANLSRSHDAIEKLDKIMLWLSQYKDALSHYNNNLEDMMDRLPGYAQHIWNSKTAEEAWPHLAELAIDLDAAVTKTLRIRSSNPGLVRTILRDTFGKW